MRAKEFIPENKGLPNPGTYEQEYGAVQKHGPRRLVAMTNEAEVDEEIAYHGSVDNITKFRPLTHFGTEKAAKDRMQFKKYKDGKIYKVDLNIKNPLTIKDFPGVHSPTQFAFELNRLKLISQQEMLSVTDSADIQAKTKAGIPFDQAYAAHTAKCTAALLRLMKKLGYDGFVYKNRYEDKGNISYVILDPRQVKILSVEPVTDKIDEALDSSYDYRPGKYDNVFYFDTENGQEYKVELGRAGKAVEVSFYARGQSDEHKTGVTGTGNASKVFGTVVNIVKDYVTKNNIRTILFTANNNQPSRVRLYNTLASKVDKVLPDYTYIGSMKNGNFTQFTIKHNDAFRSPALDKAKQVKHKALDAVFEDTTTLTQLYQQETPDDDEAIWDYGTMIWDTPFEIKQISPNELSTFLRGQYDVYDLQELFSKMSKKQERIIKKYSKDPNLSSYIIVLDDGYIVDGNHRAIAAALTGKTLRYIDLSDDEDL